MIRFHYHELKSPHRVGSHTLPAGTRCCHVYSTEGRAELVDWGRRNGLVADWLHDSRGFVHFDVWGLHLVKCGEGVRDEVFRRDVAAIRRETNGPATRRPCCRERTQAQARSVRHG